MARDAVGTELYRRNAFAVTGLTTYASRRDVRRQRLRLDARLNVADDWSGATDSPVAGGYSGAEARQAFEHLTDPVRRLLDEALWWWDVPEAECGCPVLLHQEHDAAVRAHATVLEVESGWQVVGDVERLKLWDEAGRKWRTVLADPAFAAHLKHRIGRIDDPRLRPEKLDELIGAARQLLVSPLEQLARETEFTPWLNRVSREWLAGGLRADVAKVHEKVVDEALNAIEDQLREVREKRNARQFKRARAQLVERILPALSEARVNCAGGQAWRVDQTAHQVAIALNNLAIDIMNDYEGEWVTPTECRQIMKLAQLTLEAAPPDQREEFRENAEIIFRTFGDSSTDGENAEFIVKIFGGSSSSSTQGELSAGENTRAGMRESGFPQPLARLIRATVVLPVLWPVVAWVLRLISDQVSVQGSGVMAALVAGVPTTGVLLLVLQRVCPYLITVFKRFGLGWLEALFTRVVIPLAPLAGGVVVGLWVFEAVTDALG
ncbi:MAG: hypothetical protein LBV60_18580 [Streptomyces sp.]|nr:hypothetical protein [Streptomyces sp.]